MHKYLTVALSFALFASLSLFADDTELENDLKSVMLHLDKTQKESAQKIEALTATNEKLTKRNKELSIMNKDLSSANIQLLNQLGELKVHAQSLEQETRLLREKLSDEPVREIQTASLSPTPAPKPTRTTPTASDRITPATLEGKKAAKPKERFGPIFAETEPETAPVEPPKNQVGLQLEPLPQTLGEPVPDFSLSGARRANALNMEEHLSDGTVLLVNINTATDRELRLIPGVGPALAKKIIADRPYNSIWELMKIDGINRNKVEAMAPYMTME